MGALCTHNNHDTISVSTRKRTPKNKIKLIIHLLNNNKFKNKNKEYQINCMNYIISTIDHFNPINKNMIEGTEIYDLSIISKNEWNISGDFTQIINLLNKFLITNHKNTLDYARMYLVQIKNIIEINDTNFL